ncbi:MAG: UDP-N-acetylmuramoyl-L-alanine--D-glutamate ligase [Ruminiclostridium sp.]|nr:UDP-N-acetylmuramoyl-L-alanine--D-glutamate ligase [Ruminiclostridium sp.]
MSGFYNSLQDFFTGKNVLILGFGREGRSTLKLLKKFECSITIADRNDVSCAETEGIEVISGENYLGCLGQFDVIMKAPGIALFDSVPDTVKKKITSQTDLLLRYCTNRIIGITGTKGKSTTSSLTHHILTHCGKKALLIGNIGVPPLECIPDLDADTIIVCEMSCHQLEYVQASPEIAVYLNLFEEHLDHYTGFDAYRAAKENIYLHQKDGDTLIVNKDLAPANARSRIITASLTDAADICLNGDSLVIEGYHFDIQTKLLGRHNLYNIGIAMKAAQMCGCDNADILAAVSTFDGLRHRLENVGTINGVTYINDSISTCPSTAIAAVRAFGNVDTIIVGGMDRGIDYTGLVDFLNASDIANVILLPDSGHKIEPQLDHSKRSIYHAADLNDAVAHAKTVTKQLCLLSPAAASYGFYKNFEERGDHFRELVNGSVS